jgi:type I restriction enzyme R subunit
LTKKSDLFDVLEYVFNSEIKPITREAVVAAQAQSSPVTTNKRFIEFVLTKYIETGVEELTKKNFQSYSQTNISP